jgi:COMPASS component SWD3
MDSFGGGEAFLKEQLERALKEIKTLKQRLDVIERENGSLKKSIYELTINSKKTKKAQPFLLDFVEEKDQNGFIPSAANTSLIPTNAMQDVVAGMEDHQHHQHQHHRLHNVPGGKDNRHFVHKCDLKGHLGAVYCVSFSPCGLILGSGSFDKSIKLWDIGTQKEVSRNILIPWNFMHLVLDLILEKA